MRTRIHQREIIQVSATTGSPRLHMVNIAHSSRSAHARRGGTSFLSKKGQILRQSPQPAGSTKVQGLPLIPQDLEERISIDHLLHGLTNGNSHSRV